jgi:hypothetical protein
METNMAAGIVDAQGPGIADRIKTCVRASTPKKARPGE